MIFEELLERLCLELDPDEICELLNLSSEDLVRAFEDKIFYRQDKIVEEMT